MRHDGACPFELDLDRALASECWCGAPTDASAQRTPLGVAFCSECRARVLRSCASILAIAQSPALAPRRPASRR